MLIFSSDTHLELAGKIFKVENNQDCRVPHYLLKSESEQYSILPDEQLLAYSGSELKFLIFSQNKYRIVNSGSHFQDSIVVPIIVRKESNKKFFLEKHQQRKFSLYELDRDSLIKTCNFDLDLLTVLFDMGIIRAKDPSDLAKLFSP